MTEPTQTPWWLAQASTTSGDYNIWAQVNGERCIIGKMFTEANATRLVTAVQSHDALVKALEAVVPILPGYVIDLRSDCLETFAAKVADIAHQCRAALRLTRGERS